jgi:hypothetical protein
VNLISDDGATVLEMDHIRRRGKRGQKH